MVLSYLIALEGIIHAGWECKVMFQVKGNILEGKPMVDTPYKEDKVGI